MKDSVCGCPITAADRARELAHLREDLARLDLIRDEQPKRYARHAEQYDRWQAKLEVRILENGMVQGRRSVFIASSLTQ